MRFSLKKFSKQIQTNILISIVICYVIGAFCAQWADLDRSLLQVLSGVAFVSLIILFILRRYTGVLVYTMPFFILTGLIHTSYSLLPPDDPGHIYNRISERTKVTLTGTVLQMPEFDGYKTRFILDTDSVLIHKEASATNQQVPTTGRVRLSFKGQFENNVRPGDQLMVLARVNRINNYKTPGVFDYRLYLASQGIYITGTIESPSQILPFQDLIIPWHRTISFLPERVRHDVGLFLDKTLSSGPAGLYRALLIGSRSGINANTLEQFKATGCMHLLAISGVHMGLLGMMVFLGIAWLMKRSRYLLLNTHIPTLATLVTLMPLVVYAYIAGLNTPVIRALIMAIFFLIAVVLRRQKSILHIIAAAALIVLIFNPLVLFTVSFQLSFSSILAIALIYPRLLSLLEQKELSIAGKLYTYFCTAIFVSIAATMGSLPFMLFHFNRFSTVGPLMNLLVEPFLCLWSLPVGLIAMPFIFISPELAAILLKIGSLGLITADKITFLGSTIPAASLWTITPNYIEMFLYYGIILLWVFRSKTTFQKLNNLSLALLFLLFFTRGLWLQLPGKISEVSFLDIGQGSSSLIKLPSGGTILIDGGSKTSPHFNVGERIIAPFLWKKQLWQINDIIITHPHSDHFNGLSFIIEHFRPNRLWINGRSTESQLYSDLLRVAKEKNVTIQVPIPGQNLHIEKNVLITNVKSGKKKLTKNSALPGQAKQEPLNDQSLVIKYEHGSASFLFPGDISKKVELQLIDFETDLRANILLAPHHGSRGSGSSQFIESVDPELIVISAGHSNQGKYVYAGHLEQWQVDGRIVLVTSRNGTVTFRTDGTDLQVMTFTEITGKSLLGRKAMNEISKQYRTQ